VHTFAVYSLLAIVSFLSFFPNYAKAQVVAAQTAATARYLQQPVGAPAPKTIVLSLEGSFTADESAKILRATEEWNHALNGFLRLDVVAAGRGGTGSWAIQAQRGGVPQTPNQPLASAQPGFLGIGGRLLVYVDRIGTRDLHGIVLHELGHVLGLNHDRGLLMSAHYSPTADQCIDRATLETAAALHNLPVANLLWCETVVSRAK
jgi:Matrixin